MHADPAGTVQPGNGAPRDAPLELGSGAGVCGRGRTSGEACKRDHQPTARIFKATWLFQIA